MHLLFTVVKKLEMLCCIFAAFLQIDAMCDLYFDVVLGLVDAHTHPVWAGDRVHEFAMKVNLCVQYILTICFFKLR